ncbi:MAG: chromosomal replication initiator DnaA [Pseudomonadota bacterium]
MSAGEVEQLLLPFGHTSSQRRSDFLVAAPNRAAVRLLTGAWPGAQLALVGPESCGKSHLARIWAEEHGAAVVDAQALDGAAPGPLVIEDVDRAPLADAAERALFHLYNTVGAGGGALLLTGRRPPAQWPVRLPDLASRLSALPPAEIAEPDDILLSSLLVKLSRDRQLVVPPRVVQQIAARIERSYTAANVILAALDRASLAERRTISHKLAADVLDRLAED